MNEQKNTALFNPLPRIMEPRSASLHHRVLAAIVNAAALPFFALGALVVLGIALLMRFGGR